MELSMAKRDANAAFINGVPELLILRLLVGQEMYGYEIVQTIRDQSRETLAFGEGVVYPVLHALEHGGALKARRKTVHGRRRVYYRLTAGGERRLGELTATWSKVTGAIQGILQGGSHAET